MPSGSAIAPARMALSARKQTVCASLCKSSIKHTYFYSATPLVSVPSNRYAEPRSTTTPWQMLPLPARIVHSRKSVVSQSSVASPKVDVQQPSANAGEQQHATGSDSLMSSQLTWPSRSHGCGAVTANDIGSRVTICGWVDRNRDLGGMQFFDVRDHTGLLQVCDRIWQLPVG